MVATDDFGGDVKRKLERHMIGFYPEHLRAIKKLKDTSKFGDTMADVVRAAIMYLLEKEGGE